MSVFINGVEAIIGAVVGGTWTASGTWTIPAVTLGGVVSGVSTTNYFDAGSSTLQINTTSDPGLIIKSTNDAGVGAGIYLLHISASPAVNDYQGFTPRFKDNGGTIRTFGGFGWRIENVGALTYAGKLEITLAKAGAIADIIYLSSAGVFNLTNGGSFQISNTQVVGARVTGVAVTAEAIHAALVTHGLISA